MDDRRSYERYGNTKGLESFNLSIPRVETDMKTFPYPGPPKRLPFYVWYLASGHEFPGSNPAVGVRRWAAGLFALIASLDPGV